MRGSIKITSFEEANNNEIKKRKSFKNFYCFLSKMDLTLYETKSCRNRLSYYGIFNLIDSFDSECQSVSEISILSVNLPPNYLFDWWWMSVK